MICNPTIQKDGICPTCNKLAYGALKAEQERLWERIEILEADLAVVHDAEHRMRTQNTQLKSAKGWARILKAERELLCARMNESKANIIELRAAHRLEMGMRLQTRTKLDKTSGTLKEAKRRLDRLLYYPRDVLGYRASLHDLRNTISKALTEIDRKED